MFSLAKVLFVKIAILFTSLILCLLPPRELRENTEGTPTQLPANKKCRLLIFAIAIGCLVLAAIPASSLQFPSGHSGISGIAVPRICLVLAVPPARILVTASYLFIFPNGIRVFLERLVWLVLLSHTSPSV